MISILLPSYNHARYLEACLASIRAQTETDWELIIVDDGSTDDSVEIARRFESEQVRVFTNPENLGTYGTLQRALDLAKGDQIAVMNSDDLWHPEKLLRQRAAIGDVAFCYTLGRVISNDSRETGDDVHADWPRETVQDLLPFLLSENRVLASSVLFRREGLRFHTECRYSGDWVALLEATGRGSAGCVPEALTFWRVHETSTHRRSAKQVAEEIAVREAIRRRYETPSWKNLINLAALRVLRGEPRAARATAAEAFRVAPSAVTLKRLLVTFLPGSVARQRLWGSPEPLEGLPVPSLQVD